jgi:hypothetical protein
MDLATKRSALGAAVAGLSVLLLGLGGTNGLSSVNGLSANGLSANGLSSINGLIGANGLTAGKPTSVDGIVGDHGLAAPDTSSSSSGVAGGMSYPYGMCRRGPDFFESCTDPETGVVYKEVVTVYLQR